MQPCYYIIESQTSAKLPASIREATAADFERTAQEHWQTDWRTDFIQDALLEKYALELDTTKELVGLAAYRDMPEGEFIKNVTDEMERWMFIKKVDDMHQIKICPLVGKIQGSYPQDYTGGNENEQ